MKTLFKVNGMSCGHCKMSVETAVSKINNVNSVFVNLAKNTVEVEHTESVSTNEIKTTIEELGFDVDLAS